MLSSITFRRFRWYEPQKETCEGDPIEEFNPKHKGDKRDRVAKCPARVIADQWRVNQSGHEDDVPDAWSENKNGAPHDRDKAEDHLYLCVRRRARGLHTLIVWLRTESGC